MHTDGPMFDLHMFHDYKPTLLADDASVYIDNPSRQLKDKSAEAQAEVYDGSLVAQHFHLI